MTSDRSQKLGVRRVFVEYECSKNVGRENEAPESSKC